MSEGRLTMDDVGPDIRGGPRAAIEPGPAQCEWLTRPRRLKFQLGEVSIGSVSLPSLTLGTHFMRLVGGPPEPALPFERFPEGTEVVIAGSYPVPKRLPRLSILARAIRYVPAQYSRQYVDLTGSFESYLGEFSSKSRSTLRKKVRKFGEFSGGEIAWRVFHAGTMEDFHRLAFEVSNKTYQARLHLNAALPEVGRFRQELAQYADARGYLLSHGDKPIAYIFCPARDGNLLYQFVGYDPDYEQWSPGTVLQFLVLESLFAEGRFQTFDFTEGEGAHKEFFANRSVLCADIFYFRKALRNFLIVSLHAGLNAAAHGSARLLDRLGLKARIKKLIRLKS
jgi:hypothetical protein